jgi:hypothetical protein
MVYFNGAERKLGATGEGVLREKAWVAQPCLPHCKSQSPLGRNLGAGWGAGGGVFKLGQPGPKILHRRKAPHTGRSLPQLSEAKWDQDRGKGMEGKSRQKWGPRTCFLGLLPAPPWAQESLSLGERVSSLLPWAHSSAPVPGGGSKC